MKKKALIIGALPVPFEGPWVVTDETDGWDVRMEHEYGGGIRIEVEEGYEARGVVVGKRVRACIAHEIPNVPHVSIWLEAKRNAHNNRPSSGS